MAATGMPSSTEPAAAGPRLTLPSRCFVNADIYAREMETIFRHCWQPIGHAADVAEPGSYITGRVAGQDVAVVRGRDGCLRGFFNVCRHRGHRLLQGKGHLTAAIICPYHAWAYGLDGRLRAAPNAKNVTGFDPGRVALAPIGVAVIGALVLVNLDAAAPSFQEEFPGVEEELSAFAPRLSELAFHRSSVVEMACNWKVAVENYGECYHCAHAHPTLMTGLLDGDAYRVELFPRHHRHSTGTTKGGATLYQVDQESSTNADGFRAWLLWPNFSLQVNPGSNFVLFHFIPNGPERTVAKLDWFFGPWVAEAERDRIIEEHSRTTLAEDKLLVEEVQIGLNNLSYDRGVLMVDSERASAGTSEHTIAHLQILWREVMGEEDRA